MLMILIESEALTAAQQLLSLSRSSHDNPESVKTYLEIFFPKSSGFNSPSLSFYKDNLEGYYNFIVTQKNPLFLPNWVSEIIQIFGNQHINTTNLRTLQEWAFGFLNKFRILCEIRAAMWWWLMFNPYQEPFNTLRVLTEWYLTAFTGTFPIILGIDIGPSISISLLGIILDGLNRLVFTMPYLPSEGEKFNITNLSTLDNPALVNLIDKLGVEEVRIFRYLPSLWYKYPIPDNLREYWYNKKPEILQYFLKNYGNLGIDFLPDRILQTEYENQINHEIITTNINNFTNIPTHFICHANELLNNNVLINKIFKLSQMYEITLNN
uniref:Uncharacterized protein n=1 Tax=Coscinodiscus wailesii TaxID=671091 RepID=A0A8A6KQ04_9STRA|nr:hypothetical protein LWB66_pgp139 [Coscinodiscus wailesii]YP_010241900.1 hypothetical protein LWB66_pgp083 [Coscinodiscus wailesii]QTI82759.1 hypothetical protein [Coscinodiscus wailesii]QTI82815.1 hypothetical protein [Coscinodiscus wailesii]